MKSVSYEKGLIERLKDPEYASVYLTEALNDGDQEVIRTAFQDVIKAKKNKKNRGQTPINFKFPEDIDMMMALVNKVESK